MNWGNYALENWQQILVLLGLLFFSGFFSGSETGLFSLTRGQIHRLGRNRSGMGPVVASLMRRPARLLQSLLLGNMIVNVAFEAIAAVMIITLSRRGLPSFVVAPLAFVPVLLLILAGEVTPKMLAYRLGDRWALASALPVATVARVFAPVVWVLERAFVLPISRLVSPSPPARAHITAAELSAILDISARRGLIPQDANALMQEIVHLTDIRVADIMIPRVDVIAYDVGRPSTGLAELFAKTRLRKVPVYDGEIDNVLGVVHAKRLLLDPQADLRSLIVKVPFIPEAANIERGLHQLQLQGAQMAIVVDEYGGVAGLITLEDIVEQIVGDIEQTQEATRAEPVRQISANQYLLDGDLPVHEWVEAFSIDLAERRISTIGGMVFTLLGRMPSVGDTATYRNLRFRVEQMRGRRISKVNVELIEENP